MGHKEHLSSLDKTEDYGVFDEKSFLLRLEGMLLMCRKLAYPANEGLNDSGTLQ